MLRPTPLVLFDQSLKTSFLSILSLLFLIKHLQFKIWSISILNSTQWKLFGASLARTIQMELLCTATCILCIKCPLICNRNTRLKCRLRVPFSLASALVTSCMTCMYFRFQTIGKQIRRVEFSTHQHFSLQHSIFCV